jgi:hypothetical protein
MPGSKAALFKRIIRECDSRAQRKMLRNKKSQRCKTVLCRHLAIARPRREPESTRCLDVVRRIGVLSFRPVRSFTPA